jgi:hypothetical protein
MQVLTESCGPTVCTGLLMISQAAVSAEERPLRITLRA